jgi:putative DNA primase/helicase
MADIVSLNSGIDDIQPENIPKELTEKSRWLLWQWELRSDGKGGLKKTKPPYQLNGKKAKVNDPETWTTFEKALAAYEESKSKSEKSRYGGIGFVLSDDDDIIAWDLDHCINYQNAIIEPWAEAIINQLNSYTEITPSGEGLRIFVKGDLPEGRRKKGPIECYKNFRFITVTGNLYLNYPTIIGPNNLETYETFLNNKTEKNLKEEIKKERKEKKKTQLDLLQEGLWKEAGYPSQSEADLAFCRWLAEEENGNRERIDQRFRESKLYRDKWVTSHYADGRTYGEGTIEIALSSWETQWRLTDLGNAKRFTNIISEDIRYCHGRWYIWDGTRLEEDDLQKIYLYAQKVIDQLREEAKNTIDKEERKKIWNHMIQLESLHRIESMIKLTESQEEIAIAVDDLDKNPFLFNCANGILDIDGRIKPHAFEEMITKLSQVKINPKAKFTAWEKFLIEILPDKEIREFLQRAVGYSMTGSIVEQVLFFAYGTGSNGKSTFFHIISKVFGDYFNQLPVESLMASKNEQHPTVLADLRGIRFVLASEPEDGRRFNEGLLKQITGGEKIVARRMREDFYKFDSTAKLWIMGNHKPNIRGTDHAIWRRIRLIPFTVTIPKEKQDKDLWEKLELEKEGILMWCINGLLEWSKRGLDAPKGILAATEEYRIEMDILQEFINDELEVVINNFERHSDIYARYSEVTQKANERLISSRALIQKLREKGYKDVRRSANVLYWEGIKLRIKDNNAKQTEM